MEYKVLARIEFTSERKRMSIVVRDMKTQRIILYCKGADNVILKLLEHSHHNPELQINLVKYSLKKFSMDVMKYNYNRVYVLYVLPTVIQRKIGLISGIVGT